MRYCWERGSTRRSSGSGTGRTAGAPTPSPSMLDLPAGGPGADPPAGLADRGHAARANGGASRRTRSSTRTTTPGRRAAQHAPARERHARVGALERLRLPPPPVLGEARAPVLLGVDDGAVPPDRREPPRPAGADASTAAAPAGSAPAPSPRRQRRGHSTRSSKRRSSRASAPRSTRRCSDEADKGVEPARTSTDPNDTSARGSMRDRTRPPGSAASATIAHGPAASRQTPHSTIATRPAAASVSRQ